MYRFFRRIHLWLSAPFGLVIFIICMSGALLVFEDELTRLGNPSPYRAPSNGQEALPLDSLKIVVEGKISEGVLVDRISVPKNPNEAYRVYLTQPRRASLLVNQYTGEINGQYQRPSFFSQTLRLHRWLLGSRPAGGGIFWGKTIVGVCTILFLLTLVTGVVLWWPRTWKACRRSLRVRVKKGWHCFWRDLHIAGGMWALLILITCGLTGLTWSFSGYRKVVYQLLGANRATPQNSSVGNGFAQGGGQGLGQGKGLGKGMGRGLGRGLHQNGEHNHDTSDCANGTADSNTQIASKGSSSLPWQRALELVSAKRPKAGSYLISEGQVIAYKGTWGNQRGTDRFEFDPRNGRLTGATLYEQSSSSSKISGWIYTLHVGSWGGLFSKTITFLAALLGASLPLTGYYLWFKRKGWL